MTKTAVLLAKQRSGTRALGYALRETGLLHYRNEIFHSNATKSGKGFFPASRAMIEADPELWYPENRITMLDRFLEDERQEFGNVPGIIYDIKYNQQHHFDSYIVERWTQPSRLLKYLFEKEIPIVHLVRNNVLETYLSVRRAAESKVWHIEKGKVQDTPLFEVNVRHMMKELRARLHEIEFLRGVLRPYKHGVELEYDHLYKDQQINSAEAARIFDLIGIAAPEMIGTTLGKQSSGDYRSEVSNWDEVVQALKENGFHRFLR